VKRFRAEGDFLVRAMVTLIHRAGPDRSFGI
jgi:hypothetical protein